MTTKISVSAPKSASILKVPAMYYLPSLGA
jgi:hypothetical protein